MSSSSPTRKADREIEEDVMSVGLVAWLGVVSAILIAASVVVLTGVFYMTESRLMEEREAQAGERMTDFEAQRAIDDMVVDGYYQQPDVDDGQGSVTRGTANVPVEIGMRDVVEKYGN